MEKTREIYGLKVQCIYRNVGSIGSGCYWYGPLRDIEKHVKECGGKKVSCNNRCGEELQRQHLREHLENKGLFAFFQPCHYDRCKEYPLECPNKCGEKNIKRKDIETHRESCELEPLKCPFDHVGCTGKIQRRHMDSHCKNSVEKHLLLLAKAHKELVQENRRLLNELAEQKITSPLYNIKKIMSKD